MSESARPSTILCLGSFFKGNKFLETCKSEGWRVILLLRQAVAGEAWARESCDEVLTLESLFDEPAVLKTVVSLARTREIDRIAPLDDYDVEMAAALREHLRLPGMGETTARYFRDKLAMRERASTHGIPVPGFVHALNDDRIARFLRETPTPWVLKPRSAANAFGIRKLTDPNEVWRILDELGGDRSSFLIERFLPGDVCHVDSIVFKGDVLFAEAQRYRRPLMEVAQSGGIFASRTLPRDSAEATELRQLHARVLKEFGFRHGVTHMEFIRASEDGQLYFLETAARVGGAYIYDLVEAATGVNLWAEWAKIEMSQGALTYQLPQARRDYGGIILALARQEKPDTTPFDDPEIVKRIDLKSHIGFVLRSDSPARIESLLETYEARIAADYLATLPPVPPIR